MMGLLQDKINKIPAMDKAELLNLLEWYSDRMNLMKAQADGGYGYKIKSDAYKELVDSYNLLRSEAEKRVGVANINKLDELEQYSNQICMAKASKTAVGVVDTGLSDLEVKGLKDNFNTKRAEVEILI